MVVSVTIIIIIAKAVKSHNDVAFHPVTFSVPHKTLRLIAYLLRMALRPYRLLNSKRAFIRFISTVS